ncbi:TVP38/TMEM64 family protein [Marinicrinis sediminis]|uniref:TVP38/TMEM64 family membrane protein n=1 Tax=Marinicrinis sediminis TaxID=1652465 RepID=A0ABW5RF19_9BACL
MAVLVISFREPLMDWLQEDRLTDIPIILLVGILFGLVPVVPYGVFAGAVGVKYGFWIGGLLSVVSSTLAGMIMFMVVLMTLSRPSQQKPIQWNSRKWQAFTQLVDQHAFMAILVFRLIPFIPAQLIHIFAAYRNISWVVFLLATFLGKIPVMLVFAFVGEKLTSSLSSALLAIVIYLGFLILVYGLYRMYIMYKLKSASDSKHP